MKTISGFDQVILGDDPDRPRVKGKSISIAQIMLILIELKETLGTININTVTQLLETINTLQQHPANPSIHVTEQFKATLVDIVNAYNAGELGGGGGGTTGGGTVVFADKATLLSTPGAVGSIGVLTTEPMNQYMWNPDADRWTVKDGNIYTLATLPSDVNFDIPLGTVMILSPSGERITWS